MATLNTSAEGPAISKSYQSVVDAPLPSGPAASSPTYAQWVVYSVAAPLASAFQNESGKESVLRVHRTGEGELVDLIDEFSDGRIQFGFVKVQDPNTKLAKSVLIAWCGEGVPERTKGYFTSHLNAVSSILRGYHVQITARSDSDLTPDGIIRKVADSSGSKYSGDTSLPSGGGPPPPVASKPAFMPSKVGGGSAAGFNPLGSRTRQAAPTNTNVDEDGWGADAPPVTRSQLEKVSSAYKPTKVNMAELTSQKQEPSRVTPSAASNTPSDVVKGGYQPIGKVDIAALRREAQESGKVQDERPTTVKGSYEPVGKVDIAAIRAKAQPPAGESTAPKLASPEAAETSATDRWLSTSGDRLTSMPKPKVAGNFGASTSNFAGTRAPVPAAFGSKPPPAAAAPVGVASKTFADEGGKTPAQIWAEKKGRTRGSSGAADAPPVQSQTSGGGQWQSGYSGKKWGAVQTTRTGQSAASAGEEPAREDRDEPSSPPANVSAIRDRFKDAPPMGGAAEATRDHPPPMDLSSKPNAGATRGVPIPGMGGAGQEEYPDEESNRMPTPPAQPPRTPTPPTPPETSGSPIRVAMPVARGQETETAMEAPEERFSPPPIPSNTMRQTVPDGDDMDDDAEEQRHDTARATGVAAAETTFGDQAVEQADAGAAVGGKRAIAQYDYEKAEDNELELFDGQYVTNIEMLDEDWWMGENHKGERGLFPANYVELVEEEDDVPAQPARPTAASSQPPATTASAAAPKSKTATAQFDYEAQEDNELSFPDGATITNVEFPDEDWWFGNYGGREGLFPANYVELDP